MKLTFSEMVIKAPSAHAIAGHKLKQKLIVRLQQQHKRTQQPRGPVQGQEQDQRRQIRKLLSPMM